MLALTLLLLAPGELPTVGGKDFSRAVQEQAVLAAVKIVTPDGGLGTGVLIKRDGAFAYILTASHVVGNAERIEIHTFTARSHPRVDKVYSSARVLAGRPTPTSP